MQEAADNSFVLVTLHGPWDTQVGSEEHGSLNRETGVRRTKVEARPMEERLGGRG